MTHLLLFVLQDFNQKESGTSIVRKLLTQEGPGALFKGLVPKVAVVSPKLIFSFTIATYLSHMFDGNNNNSKPTAPKADEAPKSK